MFVVSGATGHVGSVVASELLAHGEKVRVIVRESTQGTAWSKKGAEVSVGKLEDTAFLASALKGAVGFFAMLPPNYQAAGDYYAVQRKTSDAIAQGVKAAGVPHVVMLSSIGAHLAEGNGPIKNLHYLENVLRGTGTKLTAVRAGSFQENVFNSLGAAKGAGIFPNMMASADYPAPQIATRDIGLLAAYELMFPSAQSDVVDLAGPAYSVRQVAEKLGAALGKTLQVVDILAKDQAATLVKAGLSPQMAESMAEMNAGFASGKIGPVGDRLKTGRTPIDLVIKHAAAL